MKRSELTRMSLKKAAELVGVDRAVIVELVELGCPRNRDGTLNLFQLATWLLSRAKGKGSRVEPGGQDGQL